MVVSGNKFNVIDEHAAGRSFAWMRLTARYELRWALFQRPLGVMVSP